MTIDEQNNDLALVARYARFKAWQKDPSVGLPPGPPVNVEDERRYALYNDVFKSYSGPSEDGTHLIWDGPIANKYGNCHGIPAHRVAWALGRFEIAPPGIRHRCYSRLCVDTRHWEEKENQPPGTHGLTHINWAPQVDQILTMKLDGLTEKEVLASLPNLPHRLVVGVYRRTMWGNHTLPDGTVVP